MTKWNCEIFLLSLQFWPKTNCSLLGYSYESLVVACQQNESMIVEENTRGGARPGPAGECAPAGKGCAPADEMGQN